MKIKVSLGSGIVVDTDNASVMGDASARKLFMRGIADFGTMSSKDLAEAMSNRGWLWSDFEASVEEEPEPPSKPKKKSGIFSKSKDNEEKVGD